MSSSDTTKLPNPRGPLSTIVLSSSIESANAEVKRVIYGVIETEESSDWQKGGYYENLSTELRFQIGKHAAENGVAAMMHFMLRSSF